jgi:hypothetical protein
MLSLVFLEIASTDHSGHDGHQPADQALITHDENIKEALGAQ